MAACSSNSSPTGRSNAGEFDGQLLDAAVSLGSGPDLVGTLHIVGQVLNHLPKCRLVGVGLYDARHEVVVLTTAHWDGPNEELVLGPLAPEGEEFALARDEAGSFAAEPGARVSRNLGDVGQSPLERRLAEIGVRCLVSVPLTSQKDLLGAVYAGFTESNAATEDDLEYMARFARILAPAFGNYRTRTRLAKGDRRRATLAELSHAINTSLLLESVINSAREAIGRIEGHCASIIGLFDESGNTIRTYWQSRAGQADHDASEGVEEVPIIATAFSFVRDQHKTYESEDLGQKVAFSLDGRLRDVGVRRYALAPMFVRGRIIGGFLFGTSDPHPALTTDVWLYENIALQLALAIDNAVQFEELKRLSDRLAHQNICLREEIATEHNVEGMIGRSPPIRRVFDEISRVARTDATVLVTGETGVGKELVARAIHAQSDRADHPLVKLNCAAIPENLVESELFGHERGAFTSATSRRKGRFELAQEGTLFLDEVGELSLAIQAKLLRVLQDGEFERVGGMQTIQTDARIIAATNRDLTHAVENGTLRSDLYYRLHAFPIEVPPLSQRRDDIPLLVEAFISQINRRMGKDVRAIKAESLDYLRGRDWPGNIRELSHVIERAMILCDGEELVIEPSEPPLGRRPTAGAEATTTPSPVEVTSPSRAGSSTLEDMERSFILQTLRQTGWVIAGDRGAANVLGLKPSTLRSRMKRLNIQRN